MFEGSEAIQTQAALEVGEASNGTISYCCFPSNPGQYYQYLIAFRFYLVKVHLIKLWPLGPTN